MAYKRIGTLLLSCACLLCACGDDGQIQPDDGGGGSAPSTGGAGGTIDPDGGNGGIGGTEDPTTTTSTGSSMQVPCAPLKNADDPNPTPGACEDGAAVTCGQDGFLQSEVCSGGEVCQTYELQEHRFNADPDNPAWVPARTVTWAGCIPEGAEACAMVFNGNYYDNVETPYCDGDDKIRCLSKPAPFLFDNYPQLQYGNVEGFLEVLTCPDGERCAGSDTFEELTCIDEDIPYCDGTEPSCSGNGIEYCQGTWESEPGYKTLSPCSGTTVCYEGTSGPFCREPGEVPCDDATFVVACEEDDASIVSCYQGYTYHDSCATCFIDGQTVPCRCDETASGWSYQAGTCGAYFTPSCVPQAAAECDPAVDADTCIGNVAHRCVGHWQDIDCAAEGMICGVGDGIAGCRDAAAPACTPSIESTCDGSEVVSCCMCGNGGGLFGPGLAAPCVSGYETRSDCADWGPDYQCDPPVWPQPWAECIYVP